MHCRGRIICGEVPVKMSQSLIPAANLVYLPFCWVVIFPENAEMFFFEAISPPLSHTVVLTLCNVAYR